MRTTLALDDDLLTQAQYSPAPSRRLRWYEKRSAP